MASLNTILCCMGLLLSLMVQNVVAGLDSAQYPHSVMRGTALQLTWTDSDASLYFGNEQPYYTVYFWPTDACCAPQQAVDVVSVDGKTNLDWTVPLDSTVDNVYFGIHRGSSKVAFLDNVESGYSIAVYGQSPPSGGSSSTPSSPSTTSASSSKTSTSTTTTTSKSSQISSHPISSTPGPSSSTTSPSAPASSSSSAPSQTSTSHAAAIAGGLIGGFAVLGFTFALLVFCYRRRRLHQGDSPFGPTWHTRFLDRAGTGNTDGRRSDGRPSVDMLESGSARGSWNFRPTPFRVSTEQTVVNREIEPWTSPPTTAEEHEYYQRQKQPGSSGIAHPPENALISPVRGEFDAYLQYQQPLPPPPPQQRMSQHRPQHSYGEPYDPHQQMATDYNAPMTDPYSPAYAYNTQYSYGGQQENQRSYYPDYARQAADNGAPPPSPTVTSHMRRRSGISSSAYHPQYRRGSTAQHSQRMRVVNDTDALAASRPLTKDEEANMYSTMTRGSLDGQPKGPAPPPY